MNHVLFDNVTLTLLNVYCLESEYHDSDLKTHEDYNPTYNRSS